MVGDFHEIACANWQLAESDVSAAGGAEILMNDDGVERPEAVADGPDGPDGLVGTPWSANDVDKRDGRPVAGVNSVGVELSFIVAIAIAIALQTAQLSAVKCGNSGSTNLRMVL